MNNLKDFEKFHNESFGEYVSKNIQDPDKPIYRKDLVGKSAAECYALLYNYNDIKVVYALHFEGLDDFMGVNNAENWLKVNGYTSGSMQMDSPIAFDKHGEYIPKWRAIPHDLIEVREGLDGVIIPDEEADFRKGGVILLFFKFPE
jgi:hypothetical protein